MHFGTDASPPRPRRVAARQGVEWWRGAWRLFAANPAQWVVLGLVTGLGALLLAVIPVLGPVVLLLVTPWFIARWTMFARHADTGEAVPLSALWSGPRGAVRPLLTLGVLLLIATAVLIALLEAAGLAGLFFPFVRGPSAALPSFPGLIMALGAWLLMAALAMAFWFAPALVVLRGVGPRAALAASVAGGLCNLAPFSVHAILYFVGSLVASVPLGLGWVVLLPVLLLTPYTSCIDVFEG